MMWKTMIVAIVFVLCIVGLSALARAQGEIICQNALVPDDVSALFLNTGRAYEGSYAANCLTNNSNGKTSFNRIALAMTKDNALAAGLMEFVVFSENATNATAPGVIIAKSNQTFDINTLALNVGTCNMYTWVNLSLNQSVNLTSKIWIFGHNASGVDFTNDRVDTCRNTAGGSAQTNNLFTTQAITIWNLGTLSQNLIYYLYNGTTLVTTTTITFQGQTPASGDRNNTHATINMTSSGTYSLWFGSSTNLTPENIIFNQLSSANTSITWITNETADGTYFFKASSDGGTTNTSVLNWTKDTSVPVVVVNAPISCGTNTYCAVNLTATDAHLFSYNISCGGAFNTTASGFDTTTFSINATFNITGQTTCSYEICDGHTARDIDASTARQNASSVEVRFGTRQRIAIHSLDGNLTTSQSFDRVRFSVTHANPQPQGYRGTYTYHFIVKMPPGAVYLPSTEFKGWLVDAGQKIWIDFNSPGTVSAQLFETAPGLWEATVISTESDAHFDSTGKLNCVTGSYTIGAEEPFIEFLSPTVCPVSDTTDAILFGLIFVVLITLFIMHKKYIKLPIIGMLLGLCFLPFGWAMLGCTIILGVVIMVVGLAIFLVEALGYA